MLEAAIREQTNTNKQPIVEALISERELNKDSIISVRIEEGLYRALEAQTRVWKLKNVSQTVRAILSFYFLPVVYELEWKSKTPSDFKKFEEQKEREGYSKEQIRANYYLFQLKEYIEFMQDAQTMSKHSLEYMELVLSQMNNTAQEMATKIQMAMKELEEEKAKRT